MELAKRKHPRLKEFDCSQDGCYFVTICTLMEIICAFKSISTRACNQSDHVTGRKIWQISYYEKIIRDEKSYEEIWEYIESNPLKWEEDEYYIPFP
jgi:REP element-mobilizing transposase RayT